MTSGHFEHEADDSRAVVADFYKYLCCADVDHNHQDRGIVIYLIFRVTISVLVHPHAVGFHPEADTHAPPYKAIAKRQPDVPRYPGLDRNTKMCHTCGRSGHNRYNCRFHMNEHCNSTHFMWSESPMGIEWKRLGHKYFVIDAHLPSGGVSRERKQIHVTANFEFPTEEEDIDMGNTQPKSNPRQGTSVPPYGKV